MKKIKIVNIISRLVYGGTETVVYNYYKNIDTQKFDLYIIAMNESNKKAVERFEKIGFKVILVENWEKNPVKSAKEILRHFKKHNFDIIHSHLSHTNFYFMILGWISRIPKRIAHSHLTYEDKTILSKIKHSIYKKIIKIFCTHRMACGESAAIDLFGTCKDVYILKNAINVDKFKYDENTRNEYRKNLNINKNDVVYGNIGRFSNQKNQIFLLEIFSYLVKLDKNSKLLLIGDGELRERIVQKINELNLNENVIILSNREDVNCLYQAMDSFILPSLYEGLGIVLIEAQVSGLQCFTSEKVVPIEAKVTENCEFISLEKNAEIWAKKIKSYKYRKRKNYIDEVTMHGYNISEESNKLFAYYKKIIKE